MIYYHGFTFIMTLQKWATIGSIGTFTRNDGSLAICEFPASFLSKLSTLLKGVVGLWKTVMDFFKCAKGNINFYLMSTFLYVVLFLYKWKASKITMGDFNPS